MISFKKNFVFAFIIFFTLDFILSNLFFNKTKAWNPNLYEKKYWRIASENYHHDLLPLINIREKWGKNEQQLITNSLGFRDSSNRTVKKKDNKNRILLIGDSFIEGLGYNYEDTLSGLLQKHYGSKYEILNSAVSSYSPSIYYYKTKHFIDEGYKFNKALIFLDVSDIIDETFLSFNLDGTLKNPTEKNNDKSTIKTFFYRFGYFLRDKFITFRFLSMLSDQTEIFKNYLKDRYKASKELNINFFKIDNKKINFYRMLNVDRGNWTKYDKISKQAQKGLASSEKHLTKLFNLLRLNNIEAYLVIYPWPSQIFYNDNFHEIYWKNFSSNKNINFLNLYPYFSGNNKFKIIYENFILGDVHWNKDGTLLIFNIIKKEIM